MTIQLKEDVKQKGLVEPKIYTNITRPATKTKEISPTGFRAKNKGK